MCACQYICIVHLHLCKWANTSALCISMLFDHPAHPVRPCVCLCVVCLSWNFYIRKVCVTPTQSVDASVCGLPVIVETLRTTGMHSVMLCFLWSEFVKTIPNSWMKPSEKLMLVMMQCSGCCWRFVFHMQCSTSATSIQCSSIVTEAHPPPSNPLPPS